MVQFPAFGRRRARFLAVSFLLVLGAGLLMSAAVQIARRTAFSREILALRYSFGEEATGLPGAEQYRAGVPMEEMDFPALGLTPDENRWHTEKYPVETYPLLDDLTYYRMEDGRKAAALVIPRGTQMPCLDEGLTRNPQFGYGFYSYPTDEAGWRYAAPFERETAFAAEFAEIIVLTQAETPFYYVRIEDLASAYTDYCRAAEEGWAEIPAGERARQVYRTVTYLDQGLLDTGCYLSDDYLMASVLPDDIRAVVWGMGCLLAALVLFVFAGKNA